MKWLAVFWFLIGAGNMAWAAENYRKQHDFLFGMGVMGGLYSCLLVFKFLYM